MYLKRIKELREDNDYKQSFIARFLGIKQNSYSQIENRFSRFKNRISYKIMRII